MATDETEDALPEVAEESQGTHPDAETPKDEPDTTESNLVDLPPGEALTVEESLSITLAQRTQLLVIAGAASSGKTTLIASLFHLFERAPFAGYLFAGSQTLIGFDKRCHLGRTACGGAWPDTERTKYGEVRQFLHLRLRKQESDRPPTDLLLLDLQGEHYREALDSIEDCHRLPFLRRADHFILLVDSHKLSQLSGRQKAKHEATMLLRSCLDANQLGPESLVDVIFSKWDLVDENDEAQTETFIRDLEESITQHFAPRLRRLRLARIAARPENPGFELGYGLADLFPSWVEESPATTITPNRPVCPADAPTEFDRYLKRRLVLLTTEVAE